MYGAATWSCRPTCDGVQCGRCCHPRLCSWCVSLVANAESHVAARCCAECMFYAENEVHEIISEVNVVRDVELDTDVVEILGPRARVAIPCRCELRYLVLHVKDVERHCSVEVRVVDPDRRIRLLEFSTKLSVTRVTQSECRMPLLLEPRAWNYVCLDLEHMTRTAFGVPFSYAKEIALCASMVVGRVFFADRKYEDVELPAFLRVVQ